MHCLKTDFSNGKGSGGEYGNVAFEFNLDDGE